MFTRLSVLTPIGLLVLALLVSLVCSVEAKAEAANASGAASSSEEILEAKRVPRHFNLGVFLIGQYRPTQNETIDVQFELYLVLPEGKGEAVGKELQFWKHRLREQVLTSVRLTETKEFSDPELLRLQRVIRLRINRILPSMRIDGVYITRYLFGLK